MGFQSPRPSRALPQIPPALIRPAQMSSWDPVARFSGSWMSPEIPHTQHVQTLATGAPLGALPQALCLVCVLHSARGQEAVGCHGYGSVFGTRQACVQILALLPTTVIPHLCASVSSSEKEDNNSSSRDFCEKNQNNMR